MADMSGQGVSATPIPVGSSRVESIVVSDDTLCERGRLIRLKGTWLAECGECEDWGAQRSVHLAGTLPALLDDLVHHLEFEHQVQR